MTTLPPRPGELPRLEYAIPCKRFDNDEVSPSVEDILEATQLLKPGRFEFTLAVKLFAEAGDHRLTVTSISPKGKPESTDRAHVDFTIEEASWGERVAVPISFPCETVGWWLLELKLDDQPLGGTQLWVQFAEA